MSSLTQNHLLNNRFLLKSVIGQGGFGITYLAEHQLLKRMVCIKELYISGLNTRNLDETVSADFHQQDNYQKSKRRFIEEAQKLQQFSHPNIVQVSDLFEENGTAYMVMELIEGENLKQYIERVGVLDWPSAEKITKQLLDAVEQLHSKGLLHLDIKPENILIDQQGKITLIDFGSAKEYVSEKTHGSTAIFLTHGYAPPEQYSLRHDRGTYTDIYAIGATLYFLLTREKPTAATDRYIDDLLSPHELNDNISTQVSSAIMLAMQVKPKDRFQDIGEFREALVIISESKNLEKISNVNKIVTIKNLDIMTIDIKPQSWNNAVKYSKSIGNGWRLPTKEEFLIIRSSKNVVGNLENRFYWCLDNNTKKAFAFSMGLGISYVYPKVDINCVRLVRDKIIKQ